MNRWLLRGLVTAGFAGAAWALGSAAASAGSTTTTDPAAEPRRTTALVVTLDSDLDLGGTKVRADLDLGLGHRTNTTAPAGETTGKPNGGHSRGLSGSIDARVAITRPAQRHAVPTTADAAVTAVATADLAPAVLPSSTSGDSTSDGPALASVDALVTIGARTADPGTGSGSGSGDGDGTGSGSESPDAGSPDDTGSDPMAGPAASGSTGTDTTTNLAGATGTVPSARMVSGTVPPALARTGSGAAGLALLALLLIVAGAAARRMGTRH